MIRVRGLSKRFDGAVALDRVDLEVPDRELLVLLGPSGCGKTTLLRAIAGLEASEAGTAEADGPLSLVFQDLALFPHLDVAANVGFGLRRLGRAVREGRVAEALAAVKLADLAGRRPHELSGGQQQRVALARALAARPRTLLLDEPLGALDPDLREAVRGEVRRVHDRLGPATMHVTYDREEAFRLADRLAVMRGGRIEQTGAPEEVYRRPRSRFVAALTGEAGFIADGGRVAVVRPEDVRLGGGPCEARVVARSFAPGGRFRYEVDFRGAHLIAYDAARREVGAAVRIGLLPDLTIVEE